MIGGMTVEAVIAIGTALAGALGWLWKVATKVANQERDLGDLADDLEDERHERKNLAAKVAALDNSHQNTIQRVVATETALDAIRRSTERTERNVDELVKLQRQKP